MAGQCGAVDGQHVGYQRRRPERSVLHQVVSQHIETLWAEAEVNSPHGFGYPSWVKHEFERYLHCGLLPGGFSRLRCRGCGCERLVAFSCKGRICPSCVARRMADVAAQLVDRVLPQAPYRQWTLTFPYRLRLRLVRDATLLSEVLSDFLRTVFAWQRLQARRAGIKAPVAGAITLVQLWGSLLQITPHFHSWLPDGVFTRRQDGTLQFHRLAPPDDRDIERLLQRVAHRVVKRFDTDEPGRDDDPVATSQAEFLNIPAFTIPLTPQQPKRPLCAVYEGFSLHADLSIHHNDRAALERALRYGLRPPLSQRRLSQRPDGKVRLQLRKPLATGQTDILFEPVAFLRRLAASIPKPKQNMVRFHGVFAPNARVRPALAALLPQPKGQLPPSPSLGSVPNADSAGPMAEQRSHVPLPYRRAWAELLKRVHDHDVLRCPKCDGRMVPIQTVDDPEVIRKILSHLGWPTTLPTTAAPRGPPHEVFDFDPPLEHELPEVPFDA